MVLGNAIQSVLSIMSMIAIGYILTYRGWFNEETSKLFSKLVIRVSLPALMFSNLINTFDKEMLMKSGIGLLIPFGTMILAYGLGIVVGKILKIEEGRRGVFQAMFALSNTIFIGLPVNLALFGEKSVPFVLLYYIGNTTLFWTIAVYYIQKDAKRVETGIFNTDTMKRIFSPPLMGFLIALVFILLKTQPPKFIMDTCKYIGGLTTPLSMLFIGMVIYSIDIKEIRMDLEMNVLLMGRFIIAPLLIFLAVHYFSIPELMKKVFVIEAAMPVMTQTAIVAKAYEADHKYATVMASVSTIASLMIIPFYGVLLSMI